MKLAVSGEVAALARTAGKSHGGDTRWQTYYFGARHVMSTPDTPASAKSVGVQPQFHLSEMGPNQSIAPHFHQTNQFQIMAAGSATVDDKPLPVIAVHYGDHHTPFGNLTAGREGLCLFTMCCQTDPGGIYLHQKGADALMKPSKRRSIMSQGIAISIRSVLQSRKEATLESLFPAETDTADGLGAFMLRIGAGAKTVGPDPRLSGGQHYLVVNGSLHMNGASYPAWSAIYADAAETPLEFSAGPDGAEAIVMNFPKE